MMNLLVSTFPEKPLPGQRRSRPNMAFNELSLYVIFAFQAFQAPSLLSAPNSTTTAALQIATRDLAAD
jgi:hypothetical protein